MKILAIDIGNTNITTGLFSAGRLARKTKAPTGAASQYHRALKTQSDRIMISSVVPAVTNRILALLDKEARRNTCVLGRDRMVPIPNLYRRKSEVGQDRLVNAFAARRLYGAPAVIIDFGTAITFDVVSRRGEYMGGLILPGIELSLKGLYAGTALLPKVELKPVTSIIGRTTAESMRGGILFGFGAMCDGLIAKFGKLLGPGMKVVATGGNAKLMSRYAASLKRVDEDLTLKGLRLIARDFWN